MSHDENVDPHDDDRDDEEDEDDDDDVGEWGDEAKLDEIRERLEVESGRQWIEIAATLESITVAMEIRSPGFNGSIVRVISWSCGGMDAEEICSTLWIPGVLLADLQRATPTEATPTERS